ncbi:MAG: DUF5106 domain-containing protein [Muribaculum sp.]|nr:DUF5106 domain-containing protein [Muribaculum sp.]
MKLIYRCIVAICALSLTLPVIAVGDDPAVSVATDSVSQANTIFVAPLFEYPVAPDDIADLKGKTNYLMLNFWKPMDLKQKKAVDQNALNHAFSVYTAAMPHANREIALKGVDELLKSLRKNPTLLLQFTKAAEETIYGPRATMWIDEVYIKFLDAVSECKKIDKSRKVRYDDQRGRLSNSMQGHSMKFDYTDRDGSTVSFTPSAKANIIEFGNPDCDDCRRAKIMMEVDLTLNDLIDKGLVSVTFVNVEEMEPEELSAAFAGYPHEWSVGSNPDLIDSIDIREFPSFYVINSDGTIIAKNLTVAQAMAVAVQNAGK